MALIRLTLKSTDTGVAKDLILKFLKLNMVNFSTVKNEMQRNFAISGDFIGLSVNCHENGNFTSTVKYLTLKLVHMDFKEENSTFMRW